MLAALLLVASPSEPTQYLSDWGAARAHEFEAALNPLASGPKGALFLNRPSSQQLGVETPNSLAPLIHMVSAGVVNVTAQAGASSTGDAVTRMLGSGFIIDPEGYVVTNDHVIHGATSLLVKLVDGREFSAVVVGEDESVDLALLHLNGAGRDLPFTYLGDSDTARVGDWVMAIGSPFGLEHTVSHGMLSAKERILGVGAFDDFLQTDALINPGNSGGPLFNMRGEAIGVNTSILTQSHGIGFAIPINLVKDILPNLKLNGHLVRGWLGLSVKEGPTGAGAIVDDVFVESPAAIAGLQPGDQIKAENGHLITSYLQFLRDVALASPGSRLKLVVTRGGTTRELALTLSERPAPEALHTFSQLASSTPVGLLLEDVQHARLHELGVSRTTGAWVDGVIPGSAAEHSGFHAGDVITAVDAQEVTNVESYNRAMRERASTEPAEVTVVRQGGTAYLTVR